MIKTVKTKKVKVSVIQWVEIKSDEEFISLFANAQIIKAYGEYHYPDTMPRKNKPLNADVYWHFSDNSWLAMELDAVQFIQVKDMK